MGSSISPAIQGYHSLGATYQHKNLNTQIIPSDHLKNIAAIKQYLPQLIEALAIDATHLTGKVGFRYITPDYLPIVGPAPIQ